MYYGINYAVIFRVCFDCFAMFHGEQLPLLPKFSQNRGNWLLFKMLFGQKDKNTEKKLLTSLIPDQSKNDKIYSSEEAHGSALQSELQLPFRCSACRTE